MLNGNPESVDINGKIIADHKKARQCRAFLQNEIGFNQ
jgi:hypothetical protein